jgi:DNA-binding MarR family transcriptional regulator
VRSAPQIERADALAAVESAFSGFMSRSSLPKLRERVTAAVGAGVDFGGFAMLARIESWGPLRTSELAERIGLDISTVSRKTADLEGAGLVIRAPDPHDRRAHLLEVTRKGKLMVVRMREVRSALLEETLHGWSTAEIQKLARMLERFASALAEIN